MAADHERAREFAIDTVVVALTQLLLRARGLVLLPVIVKVLGTAAYGTWAQVIAFVLFVGAIVALNLHLPLVREIAADSRRGPSVYTTLLVTTVGISGAVAVILAMVPDAIARLLLDDVDVAPFVRLALLIIVFTNLRTLNTNLYRAVGRLRTRSAVELLAAGGELAGTVILLQYGEGLAAVFQFVAIWYGVIAVAQTAHCVAIVGWGRFQRHTAVAAIRYSIPLIPASFANIALDRIDRFAIGYYLGAVGVGVYSANYTLAALVMLFQTPFQITLLPKVSELWDRDRPLAARYIAISTKVFLTLAIPFTAGLPLIAPQLLALLGNREIGAAAGWTTFLIAAGVSLWGIAIMQMQIFLGARRPGICGIVPMIGAVVNLALNVVLVPRIGVAGAAAATLVAYALTAILLGSAARTVLRIDYGVRHLALCVLAAASMAILLAAWNPRTLASLVVAVGVATLEYIAMLYVLRRLLLSERDALKIRSVLAMFRRSS
jgi:O-antigen/teichoic acid export membrane protein